MAPDPRPGVSSPFSRLASTHALAVAGDTLVTLALASSLFFSIRPNAARGRVALYLLFTMAPFAVVAPLLGPVLDRRRAGRRAMVVVSAGGRAAACLLLAGHLRDPVLLFPLAFAVLVLSKAYLVAKSALVPSVVHDDRELVEANSRLGIIAVLAGLVAAAPGAALLHLPEVGGGPLVLSAAAVVFGAMAIAAARLDPAGPEPNEIAPPEQGPAARSGSGSARAQLRVPSVVMAAGAMAVLRGVVGFFTFLVAFGFRRGHEGTLAFGLVLGAGMVGSFLGALLAPKLRRRATEESMLIGSLLLLAAVGLVAARLGGSVRHPSLAAVTVLGVAIGLTTSVARTAFDAVVQRDAPDAARGRAFARFETEFQLVWVASSAIPVVVPIPIWLGMGAIAVAAAFAAFTYVGGRQMTGAPDSRDA
ncbi:MAG: MFS transporter [Acidimicrobiales bacterium]